MYVASDCFCNNISVMLQYTYIICIYSICNIIITDAIMYNTRYKTLFKLCMVI